MSRNASGTMSWAAGQGGPVTSGATITKTWADGTFADILAELTDSLSRSGKGPMQAALELVDGAVGTPALSFDSDTDTGLYLAAVADLRLAIAGALVARWISTGLEVTGSVSADTVKALTATSLSAKGAVADGGTAVGVVLDNATTLANASAKLVSIRNNGSEKAYFDKDGALYVGTTNISGNQWVRVVASSATQASNSAVDISGLTFSCATNTKYLVRAKLFVYATNTTDGLGVSVKSGSSPITSSFYFVHRHAVQTTGYLESIAYSAVVDSPTASADSFSNTAGAPAVDEFDGYFVTTGTGTFQLRLISETVDLVYVKAGSYLEYCVVP